MRWLHRVQIYWLISSLAACAQLQPRPDLPFDAVIPLSENGPLDRAIAPAEAQRPGQSAFRLVIEGPEAFAIRVHTARLAVRSLDVQTYIWHADLTGMYLAQQLIEAADRGVRVRLLVDDMDARAKNAGFAALAAHQNIDVRLFNPFASRTGMLGLIGEGLTNFGRVNRRMHNKSWIADNRIALVGGRNIGNEYFGANDGVNFVDLDFAMIGPVVRDASASFDKYWNSALVYPIESLDAASVNAAELDRLRALLSSHAQDAANSRYATELRAGDAVKRLVAGDWPVQWVAKYTFVSDDPLKVTMTEQNAQRTHVGAALLPWVKSAQTDITIISPYFVPGEVTTDVLVAAAGSGKRVRVLTNSLVASDVAAVHGGYSRHRKPLLAGGVNLYELKPETGTKVDSSLFGSSGASLHTKAFAVDKRTLFVGSYNLDPRSTWLNCEQGVLVENAVLASQLETIFATQASGQRAWQVMLKGGDLAWTDGNETFDSDPKASAGKRFTSWLTRVLGLEALL
jgi:putative cardiolipin synthase